MTTRPFVFIFLVLFAQPVFANLVGDKLTPKTPIDVEKVAAEDQKALDKMLFEYGKRGPIGALEFEIENWGEKQSLSHAEVAKAAPKLADSIWPKDKRDEKLGAEAFLKAVNEAKMEGLDRHRLATIARLKAENMLDKDASKIQEFLQAWSLEELKSLKSLDPKAELKDLAGLSKEMQEKIAEALGKDPEKEKIKISDLLEKDNLVKIYKKLSLEEQIQLHAALDHRVARSHDQNISPSRYGRVYERYRARLESLRNREIAPRAPPNPDLWHGNGSHGGGGGPGGGGGGQTIFGGSGRLPDAQHLNLCEEEPSFKEALWRERDKSKKQAVNHPITIQRHGAPGVSGLCGSSLLEEGTDTVGKNGECTTTFLTAAHCIAEGRNSGRGTRWSKPRPGDPILHSKSFSKIDVNEVIFDQPLQGLAPGVAGDLGHDVALIKATVKCSEIQKAGLVKIARPMTSIARDVMNPPLMLHLNPDILDRRGCGNWRMNASCNGGVLAIKQTGAQITWPLETAEVDVRNSCNEIWSGSYPHSIQQGTSGSPVTDERGYVVGVCSTKSQFARADGFIGGIALAGRFARTALGLLPDLELSPSPNGLGDRVHGKGVTPGL